MFVKSESSEFHYSCLFIYKGARFSKLYINLDEPKTQPFSINNLVFYQK